MVKGGTDDLSSRPRRTARARIEATADDVAQQGEETAEAPNAPPPPDPALPNNTCEALFLSRGGGVLVLGWADDSSDPIRAIRVQTATGPLAIPGRALARVRRTEVEARLMDRLPAAWGYIGLAYSGAAQASASPCRVDMLFESGSSLSGVISPRLVDDQDLRSIFFAKLMTSEYFGDPQVKMISSLERGQGEQALALNRAIVDAFTRTPHVERFGPTPTDLLGSLVVCLYGRPEFLFLQCALFADLPGMERYEFIFVSNSPELAERLLVEGRLAALTYALSVTVMILPGNAGFAGANNAAVAAARSDRLLILNPDVFPKDPAWALKHSAVLLSRPEEETRLFGAPLYYDNGSLMHAGMYLELDQGVVFEGSRVLPWQLLRVEHYGKGGFPEDQALLRSRPVPAVTGAFMSISRGWFEQLGGFSTDYIFGHYEDADLCLRSFDAGSPVWIHDVRLWHLEGGGSARAPEHEAASVMNRWVFTSHWGGLATAGLLGPKPTVEPFASNGSGEQ